MEPYIATESGMFVSSEQMRIADILKDYDENLCLVFIPEELRGENKEEKWGVIYRDKVVARFEYCDHRILAHMWTIDSQRNDILAQLDAQNAAARAVELKKQLEEAEIRQDLIASTMKTPLHNYKLPNGTVIRS